MDDETTRRLEDAKVGDLVLICLGECPDEDWIEDLDGAWIGEFNGLRTLKLISGESPGISIKSPAYSLGRLSVLGIEIPSWTIVATNGTDLTRGEYANPSVQLERIKEFYVGVKEIGKRLRTDSFYGGLARYFK